MAKKRVVKNEKRVAGVSKVVPMVTNEDLQNQLTTLANQYVGLVNDYRKVVLETASWLSENTDAIHKVGATTVETLNIVHSLQKPQGVYWRTMRTGLRCIGAVALSPFFLVGGLWWCIKRVGKEIKYIYG